MPVKTYTTVRAPVCVCVFVYRERERERERALLGTMSIKLGP